LRENGGGVHWPLRLLGSDDDLCVCTGGSAALKLKLGSAESKKITVVPPWYFRVPQ
jgi:hypothetical protein